MALAHGSYLAEGEKKNHKGIRAHDFILRKKG